ncbi:hypothetical protein J4558_21720 [Leptolyngbya sp. 15MV]|nr:hypothetical protein J4558_21720 [Leptolyngbya sp. 15MV]
MAATARDRILQNLALDAAAAALALPAAIWLAAPGAWPPALWWLLGLPLAVAAPLAIGWPLGLSRQYWRFASIQRREDSDCCFGTSQDRFHVSGRERPVRIVVRVMSLVLQIAEDGSDLAHRWGKTAAGREIGPGHNGPQPIMRCRVLESPVGLAPSTIRPSLALASDK